MANLIFGCATNDAGYAVQPSIFGRQVTCKFYQTWLNMLRRCYSDVEQARFPTYIGCTVCNEWHLFSNFKRWMEAQDWRDKSLDKDILLVGNKVYSPDACVFVTIETNTFVIDSLASRGNFPLGVNYDKSSKKYRARCRNPFTKKADYIGRFSCPQEAHQAWRKRKREIACQLAEIQTDERVANALRERYA